MAKKKELVIGGVNVKESPVPFETKLPGGLPRLLQIWEELRDKNEWGFGEGPWLVGIEGWNEGATSRATTCSPFTAQAIAMAFDPRPSPAEPYAPALSDGTPLPIHFEKLHMPISGERPKSAHGAAASCVHYGLARAVKPEEMRRGDVVQITWKSNRGHAVFCWDVHLDASGKVDCFQYVSSNGNYIEYDTGEPLFNEDGTPKLDKNGKQMTKKILIGGKGAGVTVAGSGGLVPNAGSKTFINGKYRKAPYYTEPSYADPSYRKKEQLFIDKDYYVEHGTWYVLPGVDKSKIDRTTFRKKPRSFNTDIGALSCARLHGVEPPEPFAYVKPGTTPPPAPTAAPAPRVEPQPIPRAELQANPEAPRSLPPKPVEQPADQPLRWQRKVEEWLQILFQAKAIAADPGSPDDVNDERSQAALKEFQEKNGLKPTGIADPGTRKKLEAEAQKARSAAQGAGGAGGAGAAGGAGGGASSSAAPAAPPKPEVHNLYWATGWAREGDKVKLHAKAPSLAGKTLQVTLRNAASKKESAVVATLAVAKKKGKGTVEIEIPALAALGLGDRADGATWAEIDARASDGTVEATTGAPLYVDVTAGDWDDYVGKPACADDAVEKVVKARAARNLARFRIGWKNTRYGDGYQFVSKRDDDSAEGKDFRRRVRARLESIIDASAGDRKRLRQARAFLAFQDIEGTVSDINAYDGQIVTWGVGFGGHGQLPDILARMTKERAVVDLWHECGLRFTGDAKTCSFDVLDVERKVVVSGKDPALRVIASKDAGDRRREPPELLQLLIHTAYEHTDLAVDAQFEGFRAKAGDVGHDERIKNQSLFTAIAHIRHWLPAYGSNPGVKWAHERAVADGAPAGPSDETDRKIARWFVHWFCGRMLRAGKDPANRWTQLRENFVRMKDREFNPRAEDELLDIGGDPLFSAAAPPKVPEDVLATIPKP